MRTPEDILVPLTDHLDGGGPRDYAGPSHRRCNRQAGYVTLVGLYAEGASRDW